MSTNKEKLLEILMHTTGVMEDGEVIEKRNHYVTSNKYKIIKFNKPDGHTFTDLVYVQK